MIKVLVIEPFQEHHDTLISTLNMYGCEAKGANTIKKAFEKIKTFNPHLILIADFINADKAWQFGAELLKDDPKSRPYMVVLAGLPNKRQKALCEEHGFDDYASKPIELPFLLRCIAKARERAEQEQPK